MSALTERVQRPCLIANSGALTGAFFPGAAVSFYEHGLIPKVIGCSSVGIINGLKLVEDNNLEAAKKLYQLWIKEVEQKGPSSIFRKAQAALSLTVGTFLGYSSLFDKRGIERLLKLIDYEKVAASSAEVLMVMGNETGVNEDDFSVVSSREERLVKSSDLLYRYAKAGICYCPGFDPEDVQGEIRSDGYLAGPIFERLENTDCDSIFFVMNDCPYYRKDVASLAWPRRLVYCTRRLVNYGNEFAIKQFLERRRDFHVFDWGAPTDFRFYNQILSYSQKLHRETAPQKPIVVIWPQKFLPKFSSDSFEPSKYNSKGERVSKGDIPKRLEEGEEIMSQALDALEKHYKNH